MVLLFFSQAALAPQRRRTLYSLAVAHGVLMTLAVLACLGMRQGPMILGQVALTAGVVEGALVLGWRLTQLPKSQALEFLLVSPLRPTQWFLGEALVGLSRLALVTLGGLPALLWAMREGLVLSLDLPALLVVPWAWGAVTGLGLAAWAYESRGVRRWGERILIVGTLVYLLVGVLAAEQLPRWVAGLPSPWNTWLVTSFRGLHEHNPFGVMRYAFEHAPDLAWERLAWLVLGGLMLAALLSWRSACRLQGHFRDLHYRPVLPPQEHRPAVGDRPLAWWAVRRVSQYAGRINLWLAGGFGLLYGLFVVAEPIWPSWLGKQVFVTFDRLGGIPMVATALVLLAAVPAAFQYGLWDSSTQDRCRRLELLLLTDLEGRAYWEAAAAAAWNRGRGYFFVAALLGVAALVSGRCTPIEFSAALAAALILWGLFFTLGFQAFSRGIQANLLGLGLTLTLPMATAFFYHRGWEAWAQWLPPGGVFQPLSRGLNAWWWLGPSLAGVMTLVLARIGLSRCVDDLRRWYDANQGAKVMG